MLCLRIRKEIRSAFFVLFSFSRLRVEIFYLSTTFLSSHRQSHVFIAILCFTSEKKRMRGNTDSSVKWVRWNRRQTRVRVGNGRGVCRVFIHSIDFEYSWCGNIQYWGEISISSWRKQFFQLQISDLIGAAHFFDISCYCFAALFAANV